MVYFLYITVFILLTYRLIFSQELTPIECNTREFDICRILRVIDGDTYELKCLNRYPSIIKLRLKDIDVFESYNNKHINKQKDKTLYSKKEIIKYGKTVKDILKQEFENRIIILVLDDDRKGYYGRYLGKIYFLNRSQTKLIDLNWYIRKRFPNYYFNEN